MAYWRASPELYRLPSDSSREHDFVWEFADQDWDALRHPFPDGFFNKKTKGITQLLQISAALLPGGVAHERMTVSRVNSRRQVVYISMVSGVDRFFRRSLYGVTDTFNKVSRCTILRLLDSNHAYFPTELWLDPNELVLEVEREREKELKSMN